MNEDLYYLGIKGIIRNKSGQILLLKVNPEKFGRTDKLDYWDIPGGRIQKGSSVVDTLKREILEETGIDNIYNITHIGMVISNLRIPRGEMDYGLILSVCQCSVDENFTIKLSDEHLEFNWFSPEEAASLLKVKYPIEFTEKIKSVK